MIILNTCNDNSKVQSVNYCRKKYSIEIRQPSTIMEVFEI